MSVFYHHMLRNILHWFCSSIRILHWFCSSRLLHWLCSGQPEHAAATLDVGDEVPPDVVWVQDAKLDNPAGLVEKQWKGNYAKDHDEQLTGDHAPGKDLPGTDFQGP